MIETILDDFQKLERKKLFILRYLKSKPAEDLIKCEPGKWCMIQAMRHIQMSEESSFSYMSKKSLAGDEMKYRPFKTRILLQLLYLVFHLRLKFKAPKIIANPPITSLEELEADWSLTRKKLVGFLEKYPDKWRNKAVYKHPFIGMLNITDGIRFLNAHLRHHTRQVYRIENQIKMQYADDSK